MPFEHQETLFHCEGEGALEQVTPSVCGVLLLGDIQKLTDHSPGQLGLGGPASAGVWTQGLFLSQPFCYFVIEEFSWFSHRRTLVYNLGLLVVAILLSNCDCYRLDDQIYSSLECVIHCFMQVSFHLGTSGIFKLLKSHFRGHRSVCYLFHSKFGYIFHLSRCLPAVHTWSLLAQWASYNLLISVYVLSSQRNYKSCLKLFTLNHLLILYYILWPPDSVTTLANEQLCLYEKKKHTKAVQPLLTNFISFLRPWVELMSKRSSLWEHHS